MTFDEIHVPEDADEAAEWAATYEFELRYRRMERSRDGMAGAFRRATASMKRLNLILAGDPSVPPAIKPRSGW